MREPELLICCFFLLFIDLAMAFCGATEILKQKNKNVELENKIASLEYQIQEESLKYERQVDSCLDIIVNQRWE